MYLHNIYKLQNFQYETFANCCGYVKLFNWGIGFACDSLAADGGHVWLQTR